MLSLFPLGRRLCLGGTSSEVPSFKIIISSSISRFNCSSMHVAACSPEAVDKALGEQAREFWFQFSLPVYIFHYLNIYLCMLSLFPLGRRLGLGGTSSDVQVSISFTSLSFLKNQLFTYTRCSLFPRGRRQGLGGTSCEVPSSSFVCLSFSRFNYLSISAELVPPRPLTGPWGNKPEIAIFGVISEENGRRFSFTIRGGSTANFIFVGYKLQVVTCNLSEFLHI